MAINRQSEKFEFVIGGNFKSKPILFKGRMPFGKLLKLALEGRGCYNIIAHLVFC